MKWLNSWNHREQMRGYGQWACRMHKSTSLYCEHKELNLLSPKYCFLRTTRWINLVSHCTDAYVFGMCLMKCFWCACITQVPLLRVRPNIVVYVASGSFVVSNCVTDEREKSLIRWVGITVLKWLPENLSRCFCARIPKQKGKLECNGAMQKGE